MNEDALREMVRQALARRLSGDDSVAVHPPAEPLRVPMSHARYSLPDSGGPCLIEPAVPCNHCGYCQSHGH